MDNSDVVMVTGGTGFVGMRIVLQLLQQGYSVRTTVRNIKSKKKLIAALRSNGIMTFDQLSFIETELTKDDNRTSPLLLKKC